ncbi:peptidase domain-containing ABC transporter [Vibrio pectenicida]|uniref:Peptidase domain-containing ABC transporter n=1 Tax=Vibrio pectenicida TaxID=62763 RepID=A0A7Y3ZVZ7_9VIBR|nr:peptidase domain-containing ABC transporter [Vibrio pectenicida]NOH70151.1 peptidase domain-containing ABC transporter [Vibrio pectenicida]
MTTENIEFNPKKHIQPLLQSEAAECGLACLGMILNYYHGDTDIVSLRQQFSLSMKGCTMADILSMAEHVGMVGRGLRADLDELSELQTPCILHWEMAHFVVLEKVGKDSITILDPACGRVTLNMQQVSDRFTGVALELVPTRSFKPPKIKQTIQLRDFWKSMVGARGFIFSLLGLALILQLLGLISPYGMQIITDSIIATNDLNMLNVVIIGLALIVLFQLFTGWLRDFVTQRFGHQLSFQMQANMLNHLLRLPMSFFENRHLGDILSKIQSLTPIQTLLAFTIPEQMLNVLFGIVTSVVLLIYSPMLFIVIVTALLIYVAIRCLFYPKQRQLAMESIVAEAKKESNLMETLRSMQAIKLYGKEVQRQGLWQNLAIKTINIAIKNERLNFWQSKANELIFGAERLVILYVGASLVINGQFTLGMFMAFVSYREMFVTHVTSFIDFIFEYRMISVHLERASEVLLTEKEITSKDNIFHSNTSSPNITGNIELKNIQFQHSDFSAPVFDNLSLTINAGESVAIIGPSGVGKTTLLKLMIGLLSPQKGEILIDGKKLMDYGLTNLRTQIATVMQDEQLFMGTLAENIHFFSEKPDMEFVEQCAYFAGLHQDIVDMPMGYNTLVGEMGSTLSGGQKQRLVLARALYKRPVMMFLDEATSNLDVKLEKEINKTISNMKITRVIIAHRPETIASADRVIDLSLTH